MPIHQMQCSNGSISDRLANRFCQLAQFASLHQLTLAMFAQRTDDWILFFRFVWQPPLLNGLYTFQKDSFVEVKHDKRET